MSTIRSQAARFALIGAIGFVIDGGILTALNSAIGLDLFRSRLISFSVAVSITWYLNRQQTFADRKDARAGQEWARYAVVNGIGAMLNMAIFFWLVHQYVWAAAWPIVPLAIAAGVALVFNFFASRQIAFRMPHPR